MPVDPRKAAKALKQVMSAASSGADTPLVTIQGDPENVNRVAKILQDLGYATVSNGNIRLTESGQAQK